MMVNSIKFFSLFFISFLSLQLKSISNCEDSIKIYSQTNDSIVEVLPAFEIPIGLSNGHWNILYTNQKVKEDFLIKNDKIVGTYSQFWPNGKLMYQGHFKNGVISKDWNVYNNVGKLAKQFIYVDGIKKVEKMFNNEGKVEQVIFYTSDGSIKKITKKKRV